MTPAETQDRIDRIERLAVLAKAAAQCVDEMTAQLRADEIAAATAARAEMSARIIASEIEAWDQAYKAAKADVAIAAAGAQRIAASTPESWRLMAPGVYYSAYKDSGYQGSGLRDRPRPQPRPTQ